MLFHIKRNPDGPEVQGYEWVDVLAIVPTTLERPGDVQCDIYGRSEDGFVIMGTDEFDIAENLEAAQQLNWEYYMAEKEQ